MARWVASTNSMSFEAVGQPLDSATLCKDSRQQEGQDHSQAAPHHMAQEEGRRKGDQLTRNRLVLLSVIALFQSAASPAQEEGLYNRIGRLKGQVFIFPTRVTPALIESLPTTVEPCSARKRIALAGGRHSSLRPVPAARTADGVPAAAHQ